MKLNTAISALVIAVVGGTALSGIAVADSRTASLTAGSAPAPISFRIHASDNGTVTKLDDGHEVKTWEYSDGTIWVNAPWVDVRRCTVDPAVGSTVGTSPSRPIMITHEDANYRDWVLLYAFNATGSTRVAATVDLTMSCPASAMVATAKSVASRVSPPRLPR